MGKIDASRLRSCVALASALVLAVLPGPPSHGGEAPKLDAIAIPKPSFACGGERTEAETLICAEPALTVLDAAMSRAFEDYQQRAANPAEREARFADQRAWLAGREEACPAAPQDPGARLAGVREEVALDCLTRIYEQRLAVLSYERNATAWPHVRFRPTMVAGTGTKLCEILERDLAASFLGPGIAVNPLGEREIGFAPVPGIGGPARVFRADFDLYNRGRPLAVLQWVSANGSLRLPTVELRAYDPPAELLNAIGRGVEPLAHSVRKAGHPVIDITRLRQSGSAKAPARPRAAFGRHAILATDDMPRFFRYDGRVYLLAPMERAPGKPGDLGVYRLHGPARPHRVCLFDAHIRATRSTDRALALPEVAALERAAGLLLPTGKLCVGAGDEARRLRDHAAWRPWVLDQLRSSRDLNGERIALYIRNRALTGPESSRRYHAYVAAREAAIEAIAPFYRAHFDRTPAEAKRFAALYLDRLVSAGFATDPDDEAISALFDPDYAAEHATQKAALEGDTAALRKALGPEPKAVAKGVQGDLDEPILTDALEHPQMLRTLLDMGFDPNETGPSGRTPLMVAARLDLVEAADVLTAHGAPLDTGAAEAVAQTDSAGDPRCMTGEASVVDTPGRTALSYAAELGSPEMVRLLLDRGADAQRRDSAGRRPADYLNRRTGDRGQSDKIAKMLK